MTRLAVVVCGVVVVTLAHIFQRLIFCCHSDHTFPMTTKEHGTTVTCHQCGKRLKYDFRLMKLGEEINDAPDSHIDPSDGAVRVGVPVAQA